MNGNIINNLFVLALLATWLLLAITISVWIYRDAKSRALPPLLITLLVGLSFPLGLLLWLLLRPQPPTKNFDLQKFRAQ